MSTKFIDVSSGVFEQAMHLLSDGQHHGEGLCSTDSRRFPSVDIFVPVANREAATRRQTCPRVLSGCLLGCSSRSDASYLGGA